jgi:hypothetical protein
MARIRTIKPEFFRHELLQDLEAQNPKSYPMLVFAGLITQADKNGAFLWRPRYLKLDILPFLAFDIDQSLRVLADAGLIGRYSVDGQEYGIVLNFRKHQRISGTELKDPPKHPEPTDEIVVNHQGSNREATGKQSGSTEEAPSRAGMGMGMGMERERIPTSPVEYPDDFLSFWSVYPRKLEKAAAAKAWKARIADGHQPATIIEGAKRYAEVVERDRTEPKFIKHPATFLGPTTPFVEYSQLEPEDHDPGAITKCTFL